IRKALPELATARPNVEAEDVPVLADQEDASAVGTPADDLFIFCGARDGWCRGIRSTVHGKEMGRLVGTEGRNVLAVRRNAVRPGGEKGGFGADRPGVAAGEVHDIQPLSMPFLDAGHERALAVWKKGRGRHGEDTSKAGVDTNAGEIERPRLAGARRNEREGRLGTGDRGERPLTVGRQGQRGAVSQTDGLRIVRLPDIHPARPASSRPP